VTYASWFKRVAAAIVDGLINSAPSIIGGILDSNRGVLYGIFALAGFALGIYNSVFLVGTTGQSWGKKLLGIRLIGEQTGAPIGPLMAFVRSLAHILDALPCMIGFLWPLWDAKNQTFADKIINTVVVEA
jgi:uncharacterized RDD family membrane protein YckC